MTYLLLLPKGRMSGHVEGRIVAFTEGLALAATPWKSFVLPPRHALWLPPGVGFRMRPPERAAPRTLSVPPGMATQLPPEPYMFAVSTLLREAILRYLILAGAAPTTAPRRRLMAVIMDEVERAEPAPWFLPLPGDKRLHKITRRLLDDPADKRNLDDFAKLAGTSPRTLARHFEADVQMTFGAWRQRLRLLTAMVLLEQGTPVASVATRTGFASPSAFIAFFKRATGSPPGQYFRKG